MIALQNLRVVTVAGMLGSTIWLTQAPRETIDLESLERIKTQGLSESNSQVMELAGWLTDVYGPRLTGSTNTQKAGDWAVKTMQEWGLVNVQLEPWPEDPRGNNHFFPRGWSNDHFYLAAVTPQTFPILGTPAAWTPGTNGLVRGETILVTETTEAQLRSKYAGKLRGKWVLLVSPPNVQPFWNPIAKRLTDQEIAELERSEMPKPLAPFVPPQPGTPPPAPPFDRNAFFFAEGALGLLTTQPRGHGIYSITGRSTDDPATTLPRVAIPAEGYGRIARLMARGLPVVLEADIRNTFTPTPRMFNIVGEIRGTDKADELVMIGAHFDSWHSATGAADNGAGAAMMLEAMRILKQSGVRLRRTVRIGLWTGEEQGLVGSRLYTQQHFGTWDRPATTVTTLPDHEKLSVYFNLDSGGGAIRGVYLEGHQAVGPIFRQWMQPLRSLGVTALSLANDPGSDHENFDRLGLPAFDFMQDSIENSISYHGNMDTYERLQPTDMRQGATVAAVFTFLAANREERLPRKPR